ncbi:hypothetical protein [Mucisphaera sp.]|uniref:hypothetical protein n=1 Tax=Mucisphaera sp. TaxID=2913024 RepID=UPI003D14BE76
MKTRALALLLLTCLLMTGCRNRPPVVDQAQFLPPTIKNPPALPTYQAAAEAHNRRVDQLDRLWAATSVRLEWVEDDDRKAEQGDGNLLMIRPDRLALTVGKLGHVRLWAGMNPDADFLFDLRDGGTLYLHQRSPGMPYGLLPPDLPVPLQPRDMPWLLGVMPLPPTGHIESLRGYWLLEPDDVPIRLLLDPYTAEPLRIDRIGPNGRSDVIALHRDSSLVGGLSGQPVSIARRLEIMENGKEARIDLELDRLRVGSEAESRLRPAAFDLDRLIRAHKPDEIVDIR